MFTVVRLFCRLFRGSFRFLFRQLFNRFRLRLNLCTKDLDRFLILRPHPCEDINSLTTEEQGEASLGCSAYLLQYGFDLA